MFVFGTFTMTIPKPFAGNFLIFIICTYTLHRSVVSEHCDVGKHLGIGSCIKLCSNKLGGIWLDQHN